MKQFFAFLLCALLVVSGVLPAFAADNAASGDWRYTVSGSEATVTGYQGSDSDVEVPSELGGHPVTAVGTAAFYRSDIQMVSIPSTVRTIGWWAFYGASALREVRLSDGLQTVGFGAFLNCPALKSVTLPSTVSEIGGDAFGVLCTTEVGVPDDENDRTVGRQTYSKTGGFRVAGYSGTAAQAFADENGLIFESLGELRFGDLNRDEVIDTGDILLLENYIDGGFLAELKVKSADLNADGVTDEADLSLLRSYICGERGFYSLPATRFMQPEQHWLDGLRLYSDGDSIAKGTGTNTFGSDFHSYAHFIAEKHGMDLTTKAIGGTTLAKVKKNPITDSESILERVLSMRGDYDVILLDGGFNDIFLKVRVGEMTPDDFSGRYDRTTTAGALETICWFLNKNYKDAVKLFVLCHDCDEAQPLYWDVMRAVLDKWEIPYVDISELTDFRAVNTEINNQYFFCNDSKPVGDTIHPVAYAQEHVYGKLVEAKLNELFAERNTLTADKERIDIAKGETASVSFSENAEAVSISSNEKVASVSDAEVTAHSIGEAVVRAETPDGRIAAVTVRVKQTPLCFYLNKTEAVLRRGESLTLVPEFLEGTVSQDYGYESSHPQVAAVSADGVVTPLSRGSAVITCKLSNGVKSACVIRVR